ncbi:sensor histidine kinase [Naasia lichenicola]|uniref:histidine kinase n=1 Tax=Naasia lichenicola TaxID=2565933 RepID=A0A4S4FSY5_9MICO|nr:HAMP domain-containing sensor histidine kinase [Naasia lichenicola]THG32845.1 HAMP domain-containing histidine kinase [Naasia lichenicola]
MTGAPTSGRAPLLAGIGLRARIAGGSLIIAILLSVIAGIIIDAQIARIVRDGTVQVLMSDAAPFVVALQNEPGDSFDAAGPGQLVAVIDPAGVAQVDTLPEELSEAVRRHDVTDGTSTMLAAGDEYVVYKTEVEIAGRTWTVIAARAASEEDTVADQLRNLLFVLLAVIDLAVGGTAWLLSSAALAPVGRLRESAQTLSTAPGSDLLPVGGANDEIAQLARTLNELIERLRASADRERQLVSDASHELRTPLAILRTQLELARAEASSIEQLVTDIEGAERSAARLASLVSSLLVLSTIESSAPPAALATARSLEREVSEAVERARFRTPGSGIVVDYPFGSAFDGSILYAVRDEDFGRLVDNLLTNSITAVGQSGTITVRCSSASKGLELSVADTGGGLDPAFEPLALERFTRADDARVRREGAGLGLAIAAAIVAQANGTITLDNQPGDGLTVVVSLPPSAASTPAQ